MTHQEFLDKLYSKYPNFSSELLSEYKNKRTKIKVKCDCCHNNIIEKYPKTISDHNECDDCKTSKMYERKELKKKPLKAKPARTDIQKRIDFSIRYQDSMLIYDNGIYICKCCGKQKTSHYTQCQCVHNAKIINQFFEKNKKLLYEKWGDKIILKKDQEYVRKTSEYEFVCRIHGDFKTSIDQAIRGKDACPLCSHAKRLLGMEKLKERIYKLHGNSIKIIEGQEYKSSRKYQMMFVCNKGHEFPTKPSVIMKSGCPICNQSHGENIVMSHLSKLGLKFEFDKPYKDMKFIKRLKFDFAIYKNEELNCVIEFDGQHHDKPATFGVLSKEEAIKRHKLTIERDKAKNKYCLEHNIPMLRIHYTSLGTKMIEDIDTFLNEHYFKL